MEKIHTHNYNDYDDEDERRKKQHKNWIMESGKYTYTVKNYTCLFAHTCDFSNKKRNDVWWVGERRNVARSERVRMKFKYKLLNETA